MNKRVFNALSKVAADENKPIRGTENRSYRNQLPFSVDTKVYDKFDIEPRIRGVSHPTLKQVRSAQATENARSIAPFGTDLYFQLRKHLLDYGRTKQYNFDNPDSIRSMPKFDGKLDERQRKLLTEMENVQASDRRNPYSNIG